MTDVRDKFEAIPLPPGYTLEWDGEYNSQRESTEALLPGFGPAGDNHILFIIVALFNAFRPPMIIVLVIPFAVIGITFGLLVTNTPFGFIALLGGMSLIGMMIKNSVVLLDEVNQNLGAWPGSVSGGETGRHIPPVTGVQRGGNHGIRGDSTDVGSVLGGTGGHHHVRLGFRYSADHVSGAGAVCPFLQSGCGLRGDVFLNNN